MVRKGRPRPQDLSASWDPVSDDVSDERFSDPEPSPEPVRSTRQTRNAAAQGTRRRTRHDSGEQSEFIMPSSPDAVPVHPRSSKVASVRQSTPHFRLNQRSLTSDAGKFNNMRTSTPRLRHVERSMTSDAGLFARRGSAVDEDDEDDDKAGPLSHVWSHAIAPLVSYFLDVVRMVLKNLKPLLSYAVLGYLLVGGAIFGAGFLRNSITSALSPVCRVPGVSLLGFDFCNRGDIAEVKGVAEFDKLAHVQSSFDEVLSSSTSTLALPGAMMRSDLAMRDLKNVIRFSSLPSRRELVFEFEGYLETAQQAVDDLSNFNSKIGYAVDTVLNTNRWTLRIIEGVREAEEGRGSVARWMGSNLNIFAPFQPIPLSNDVLIDQYLRHTAAIEEQVDSLIADAHELLNTLDSINKRLDTINEIATQDDIRVTDNKDELYSRLWTKIGGNRQSMQKLERQAAMLNRVGEHQRLASGHVSATILKLKAIRANLRDLRERMGVPALDDRVPLEVHISAIELAVGRLEEQRRSSRDNEKAHYDRVLSRGEKNPPRMLSGHNEV